MKLFGLSFLVVFLLLTGCATVEEPAVFEVPAATEENAVNEVEPAEAAEPVYETVTVPLLLKETVYFSDGVVDRYTDLTYQEETDRLVRKETRNTYDELEEAVSLEYRDGLPVKETVYGPDSRVTSYQVYDYDSFGLLVSREFYNASGNLQTRSAYEYDEESHKIRWEVFGSVKNLLSYSTYRYDGQGRLTETKVYSPDGTLEDQFVFDYSGDSGVPSRETQLTAQGAISQIVEKTLEGPRLLEERTLGPSGSPEFRVVYEYGESGEKLRESLYDKTDRLVEYREFQYLFQELQRLVEALEAGK
ncbi:MAG: hypothetical protein JW760_08680 [Spirochaetales bacterium]|nr:hypothetical protein [Spirochaetales bacterium]